MTCKETSWDEGLFSISGIETMVYLYGVDVEYGWVQRVCQFDIIVYI